ncbi:MAG TPA: hypothetical protein H9675_04290 [Firmicutes bacterium]|nr:hypothetical protein [Bacillota bacterium]
MKKIFMLIGIALTAMLVLAGCAEKGENTGNENSSSSETAYSSEATSSYSMEYLKSVQDKLYEHMEELKITIMSIGSEYVGMENKVYVDMLDTSDEMMSKVEDIIGEEAMNACVFSKAYSYPEAE